MSREDTKEEVAICKWLGWEQVQAAIMPSPTRWWHDPKNPNPTARRPTPRYSISDANAISLLPVLVERGYAVDMISRYNGWCVLIREVKECMNVICESREPTIAQAITSACLKLIEKEAQ